MKYISIWAESPTGYYLGSPANMPTGWAKDYEAYFYQATKAYTLVMSLRLLELFRASSAFPGKEIIVLCDTASGGVETYLDHVRCPLNYLEDAAEDNSDKDQCIIMGDYGVHCSTISMVTALQVAVIDYPVIEGLIPPPIPKSFKLVDIQQLSPRLSLHTYKR